MPILPALLLVSQLGANRLLTLGSSPPPPPLFDSRGGVHRLSEIHSQRGTVVFFFATGCPLARLYAPRVNALAERLQPRGFTFVGVCSQSTDSLADIDNFVRSHRISWSTWKDRDGALAARLNVLRTPEVLVFDREDHLLYCGRVDDQIQPGLARTAATSHDQRDAVDDLLAARAIRKPLTEPAGWLLGQGERGDNKGNVVYSRHIASILQKNCQACHRRGQIGPFPLTTYDEASSWGPMIREVVQSGRMPPWHASPAHGRFSNDRRLRDGDKEPIASWVGGGCPEGDRADLPPPATFPDEWSIPTPELVVAMPRPFNVPAEGEVEYQYIEVDPGFTDDRWIQDAEVLPGCRSVSITATCS